MKLQNMRSIYKNQQCSYASNELGEKEIKKKNPFIILQKKNQPKPECLAKGAKELYNENYKIWMEDIEQDPAKWKDMFIDWKDKYCSEFLTQSNLQVQCNPYQNTLLLFTEIGKKKQKTTYIPMEPQKTLNSLNKKTKATKLCHKVVVTNDMVLA